MKNYEISTNICGRMLEINENMQTNDYKQTKSTNYKLSQIIL